MFNTLLIANRGEIACRIVRTARAMGLRTIAVYSSADADALHVVSADEAIWIGEAPARDSYLRIDALLEAARLSGAEAIHPGYGFLAENAGFARACADAGLTFVGPSADVIDLMGDKRAASNRMADSDVPVLPGYRGADQSDEALVAAAQEIGLPIMIKPSAGGGGKGMHVIDAGDDLVNTLRSARREAAAAFGDDTLLLERYLRTPRHVEVQVFGDAHGNVVHLFERDCSLQRRHQKVIEESPAPGLAPATREALCSAAVAAAKSIDYQGAGTVEFLLDAGEPGQPFYFMEMNTRLQVEHPVTELVTGVDLVEWQLRVASGEPLPLDQSSVNPKGHAVEARICAEDPLRGFLPATGTLRKFSTPAAGGTAGTGLRLDTGVSEGDEISIHYDSMVAKLVAHGPDRPTALQRMAHALASTRIEGIATNVQLLEALTRHPTVAAGEHNTAFVERHLAELLSGKEVGQDASPPANAVSPRDWTRELIAVAAAWWLEHEANIAANGSPWTSLRGWRLNQAAVDRVRLSTSDEQGCADPFDAEVEICQEPGGESAYSVRPAASSSGTDKISDENTDEVRDEIVVRFSPRLADGGSHTRGFRVELETSGHKRQLEPEVQLTNPSSPQQRQLDVRWRAGGHLVSGSFRVHARDDRSAGSTDTAGHLLAPMPGKVTQVFVSAGERVAAGAALMVLEAMKMEHSIVAPHAGEVSAVRFGSGDLVAEGEELVTLDPID